MTRTSNECTVSMSDEEWTEWYRAELTAILTRFKEQGKILDYRYKLVSIDLMEAKTSDDMMLLLNELQVGLVEKKRSVLLDRMRNGLDMIREEENEKRKEKLWSHYEKLDKELEELNRQWTFRTKYETFPETLS